MTSGQPLPVEANIQEDYYWGSADMMIQKGNNDLLIEFLKKRKEGGKWQRKENQRPMFHLGRSRKTGYSAAVTAETRLTLF